MYFSLLFYRINTISKNTEFLQSFFDSCNNVLPDWSRIYVFMGYMK